MSKFDEIKQRFADDFVKCEGDGHAEFIPLLLKALELACRELVHQEVQFYGSQHSRLICHSDYWLEQAQKELVCRMPNELLDLSWIEQRGKDIVLHGDDKDYLRFEMDEWGLKALQEIIRFRFRKALRAAGIE